MEDEARSFDARAEAHSATRPGSVRLVRLNRNVLSSNASQIENDLAKVLRLQPSDVRAYVVEVLEDRLWRGRENAERRTGFRFVRGTHGGSYVRDPAGTDLLPPGVEPPPERG